MKMPWGPVGPESNDPSSAGIVWGTPLSLFVHFTVAPTGIVTGFGEKLKLEIVASVGAAALTGVPGSRANPAVAVRARAASRAENLRVVVVVVVAGMPVLRLTDRRGSPIREDLFPVSGAGRWRPWPPKRPTGGRPRPGQGRRQPGPPLPPR